MLELAASLILMTTLTLGCSRAEPAIDPLVGSWFYEPSNGYVVLDLFENGRFDFGVRLPGLTPRQTQGTWVHNQITLVLLVESSSGPSPHQTGDELVLIIVQANDDELIIQDSTRRLMPMTRLK